MIDVCFAGVTGWTAPPIVAAIDRAGDLTLSSGVSRSAAGQSLAAVTRSAGPGLVYATVAEALAPPTWTSWSTTPAPPRSGPTSGPRSRRSARGVGSSGLTAGDYQELDRLARDRGVGVIAAGNFSVMAAVLRRAAAMAATRHLDQWEIIDYASDDKPDVPSGTAAELAETLAQVQDAALTVGLPDLHGPVEARERRSPAPGSTPCGCPASWSPPRWCSAGPASR